MAPRRTIRLGDWQFSLDEQAGGLIVGVPHRGGVIDWVPQVPEQLAWAEAAFAELPALERVWVTDWRVPPAALPDLEALFRRHGATW